MATQSPLSALEQALQSFGQQLAPPPWVVEELQRRVVLLLNHVLMQEPQAMERLVRQKGHVILFQWRTFTFRVVATPAGLLDLAPPSAQAELILHVTQDSPLAIAQAIAQGGKPAVRVEGDVQLAADVNWLVDHVRWDLEEDMARLMGDVPAHLLADAARKTVGALRQFVSGLRPVAPAAPAGGTP
jgi:ubiquinone biosynthesis accessory factor UbiJ